MKKYLLTLVLFSAFQTHEAQEYGENQLGAWYMYSGTHRITEKWNLSTTMQLWDYEPTANFNLFLVLTGIDYTFTPNLTASMGYGFAAIDRSFETIPNEHTMREHRLYEQIGFKNTFWKFDLSHRYRIEHRFLDDAINKRLKHRNRYRLQLTLPLSDMFFINLYDEVLWTFEKDGFNENRLYGAVGMCITSNSTLQLGYLKQHLTEKSYDRLQLSIAIVTDFRKHKKITVRSNSARLTMHATEAVSD